MAETFRIGLTGLNAATSDLAVTANNIANANTTGFKYSRAEFSDIFSTSALGQATRRTVGSGVQLAAVTQQFKQGNINATGNPLDIAIDGEGFFKMEAENGTVSYTRAGTFGLDSEGYIVNNTSSKLQGFPADVDGNIVVGAAQNIRLQTADIQPNQTTSLEFGINLDAAAEAIDSSITPFDPTDPKTYNYTTSATIYDSLGGSHTLSTFFVKNPLSGTSGNTQSNWTVYGTLDGVFEVPKDPSQAVSNANPLIPAINFGGRPTQMIAQANTSNQTQVTSVESTPAVTNLGLLSSTTTIVNSANANLSTPARIYFTSPTAYELRNSSTGSIMASGSYSSGQPIIQNGWRSVITGTPATGDYIDIEPQIDFSSHATSKLNDVGDPTVQANWQVRFGKMTVTSATVAANSGNTGAAIASVPTVGVNASATPERIYFTSTSTYEIRDSSGASLTPPVTGSYSAAGTVISHNGWSTAVSGPAAAGDYFRITPVQTPVSTATVTTVTSATATANSGNAGAATASEPTVSANASTAPERIYFTGTTTYEIRDSNGASLVPPVTGVYSSTGTTITHNGWTTIVSGAASGGDFFDITPVQTTRTAQANGYEILDAAGNSLNPAVTGSFTSSGTSVPSSITYGGWSLDVTGTAFAGDTYNVSPTSGSMQLTFDDHGLLDQSVVSQLTPRDISIALQPVEGVLGKPTSATEPLKLSIDFLTATQFGGQSSTNNLVQDGYASGTLVGVNVSDSGIMFGRYTNGQSKVLGQVALFNFRNVQGLSPVGDTSWAETSASGQPISGPPGSARLGLIRGGSLEGSNVEMSDQLVNMIQAQRNFQANAQVIQTANQLSQTLLQIR